MNWSRRDILSLTAGACALGSSSKSPANPNGRDQTLASVDEATEQADSFNADYKGIRLSEIAFPLGGMGAGMVCLEGSGALSRFYVHNATDIAIDPVVFAAISIRKPFQTTRVLEGRVPTWKFNQRRAPVGFPPACLTWGLPRFSNATFEAHFPFATISLTDPKMPIKAKITGWSPFSPGDADNASLPVAALEYEFENLAPKLVDAVFSFNSENFMAGGRNSRIGSLDRIVPTERGFVLYGARTEERPSGHFSAWVDNPNAVVDHAWFDGRLDYATRVLWKKLADGRVDGRPPKLNSPAAGASIAVPFSLNPGEAKVFRVSLAWYVPDSNIFAPTFTARSGSVERLPTDGTKQTYQPWYSGRFSDINAVKKYWQDRYLSLRRASEQFTHALFDSTLPPEAMEAVATNLSILKSPTLLRQVDGRLWGWEGTGDNWAYGSCTHVWNFAQAIPHLFPELERTFRETEFGPNQGADGHQAFRTALPIRQIGDSEEGRVEPPAADGQLGGIIKAYREWRVSGDTAWLRRIWPKIRESLNYCIKAWDSNLQGTLDEPHTNTYDIVFWGPDSYCTSLYLGALKAASLMGSALSDDVRTYTDLFANGARRMEEELFNGEYFHQQIKWKDLRVAFPPEQGPLTDTFPPATPDIIEITKREGPPYQYGSGCLSDGVIGAWLSLVCGVNDSIIDREKIRSHLIAVHTHNFKNAADHCKVGRPWLGTDDPGMILCTWPRGGEPTLPMPYSDEFWTGSEYQVASHLISLGEVHRGLEIVRAVRRRYDGTVRNPFDEVEAAHWYSRSMSSYALLQAYSGARFDAVERILYLRPAMKGNFRCFLSTATGYGTVGVQDGRPFIKVVEGSIPAREIRYTAA